MIMTTFFIPLKFINVPYLFQCQCKKNKTILILFVFSQRISKQFFSFIFYHLCCINY